MITIDQLAAKNYYCKEYWVNVYKYLLNDQYFYLKYNDKQHAMNFPENPLYRIHVRLK